MASIDLNEIPSNPPPPGVSPDIFDFAYNPGPIAGANGVMLFVATVAYLVRMFTKIWVMKRIHLEDYLLSLGWAFFVALEGCTFAQLNGDLGRHMYNVSLSGLTSFLQFEDYSQILYGFCLLFVKFAILLQLKRIFKGTSRDSVHWTTLTMIALNTIFYIIIIVQFGVCEPKAAQILGSGNSKGTCIYDSTFIIASGAFNLVLDILILLLPIYAIWQLRMPVKRKIIAAAVFTIGILACVASALRLYYSIELPSSTDLTFEIVNFLWTSCLECMSAILVACIPVMPRLFKAMRGNKASSGGSLKHQPIFVPHTSNGASKPGFGQTGPNTRIMEQMGSQPQMSKSQVVPRSTGSQGPQPSAGTGQDLENESKMRMDIEERVKIFAKTAKPQPGTKNPRHHRVVDIPALPELASGS